MKQFLIDVLGPNYRTTVAGFGQIIAIWVGLLYALPPDTWKKKEVWIPATFYSLLKAYFAWNTKDKQITGNGALLKPTMEVQPDGSNKPV